MHYYAIIMSGDKMKNLKTIRPITDLRNTNEISDACHAIDKPIHITKNGYSDLVIMSEDVYDDLLANNSTNASFKEEVTKCVTINNNENNFGFVRVRGVSLKESVFNVESNFESIKKHILKAINENIDLLVFPELSLTSYTCGDLFFKNSLLDACNSKIKELAEIGKNSNLIYIVGSPFTYNQKIYNCAIVYQKGKILGIVPKTYLPNYNEFYEMRQFTEAPKSNFILELDNHQIPFGNKLIFSDINRPAFKFGTEICEDLWSPTSPSIKHALQGATLLINLSASNEVIGKDEYRKALVKVTSKKLISSYVYISSTNESTSDLVYSGASFISEYGDILKRSTLYKEDEITADIDLEKLVSIRQKDTTFRIQLDSSYITIPFSSKNEFKKPMIFLSQTPFLPSSKKDQEKWCDKAIQIQAHGLAKRLQSINVSKVVLGLSGGLDSTLALLVAIEAMKIIEKTPKEIYAFSMPCFGTGKRTRSNSELLSEKLGVSFEEVLLEKSVKSHLDDLKHDYVTADVTFENAQARERTQFLFDKANQLNAIVIGTGDLSELALGYCTYNGDHMSNYSVNCSIPKTLVKAIVKRYGETHKDVQDVLEDILDTPISPELLPVENGAQNTEDIVGPYELHDFFLYHFMCNDYSFKKIALLAFETFKNKYLPTTIIKWLKIFIRRFMTQQFKRQAVPDGPKVTPISLSPRGDYRAPSDASFNYIYKELDEILKIYSNAN